MSDTQYLAALGVAMRTFFELNGEDPETLYAFLMGRTDPREEIVHALNDGHSPALHKNMVFGYRVKPLLAMIEELVNDILTSMVIEQEWQEWLYPETGKPPSEGEVEIKLRCGEILRGDASDFDWGVDVDGHSRDILFWRRVP